MNYPHSMALAVTAVVTLLAPPPVAARAAEGAAGLARAAYTATQAGTIVDRRLREISGIAASRRRDDLLWAHNDSGWGPDLHALSPTGQSYGRVRVARASRHDWEDMASFVYEGRPMLVVADVGDNGSKRAAVWLHFIDEPEVPAAGLPKDGEVTPSWSIALRYPQGPADCEAIAVDQAGEQVLLLTKRTRPPRLYAVPLRPWGDAPSAGKVWDATLLGEVGGIPAPTAADLLDDPLRGAYRAQPTAIDIADGVLVALTYGNAFRFQRRAGMTWAQALAEAPELIALPRSRQSEALAFAADGRSFYVTSEQLPAPLYLLTPDSAPVALSP